MYEIWDSLTFNLVVVGVVVADVFVDNIVVVDNVDDVVADVRVVMRVLHPDVRRALSFEQTLRKSSHRRVLVAQDH